MIKAKELQENENKYFLGKLKHKNYNKQKLVDIVIITKDFII